MAEVLIKVRKIAIFSMTCGYTHKALPSLLPEIIMLS